MERMLRCLLGAGIAVAMTFAACGGTPPAGAASASAASRTYRGAGTGAAMESLTALAARYSALHPKVAIRLEDVGSDTSVALVSSGDADFGFMSRDIKPEEKGKVTVIPFAGTGTGLAVNPANPVTALSKDQVRRIYSGEITDWSQVGGQPGEIKAIRREAGSSTRSSFEAYFFDGKPTYGKNVLEVVESTATYQAVRDFKGAIVMITIQKTTVEDRTMRLLTIDGIAPTTRNVNAGVYPVRRPIVLMIHPDRTKVRPGVLSFFDFIKSPEGQEILAGF